MLLLKVPRIINDFQASPFGITTESINQLIMKIVYQPLTQIGWLYSILKSYFQLSSNLRKVEEVDQKVAENTGGKNKKSKERGKNYYRNIN